MTVTVPHSRDGTSLPASFTVCVSSNPEERGRVAAALDGQALLVIVAGRPDGRRGAHPRRHPGRPVPRAGRARRTARAARGRPSAGERDAGRGYRSTCPTSSSRSSPAWRPRPVWCGPTSELHEAAWGTRYVGDRDSVYSLVKRLRRKLTEAGVALDLLAVRGVGFQLVPPPRARALDTPPLARWKDAARAGLTSRLSRPAAGCASRPASATRAGRRAASRTGSRPRRRGPSRRAPRPPRRRSAAARRPTPRPNQPRAIASSRRQHEGPVAEQLGPARRDVVHRPAGAVDVPEPRLAAEQHHTLAVRRVVVEVDPVVAPGSRPSRGRPPRRAGRGRASRRGAARPRRRSSPAAGATGPRRRRSGDRSSRGRRRRDR